MTDNDISVPMAAVDEFGNDCFDRCNLPYKYGDYGYGFDTEDRRAVEQAIRLYAAQAVVAALEAVPCPQAAAPVCDVLFICYAQRCRALRAARAEVARLQEQAE